MILTRCHILGFGKLRDTMLEFQSGLNLVFAANEGGKSTLQRFLTGMLYGQLRADLRSSGAWIRGSSTTGHGIARNTGDRMVQTPGRP